MGERLLVATRKGLFFVDHGKVEHVAFLGDPVSMVLPDPRDGAIYAALNLGHFGVKLHRSTDGGVGWEEIACPAFPEQSKKPEDETKDAKETKDGPSVLQVSSLEAGGPEENGTLWAGTLPGGLFRSRDRGASWHLVRSLWDHPDRKEWFGGGYDHPSIHSICVDPRDHRRVALGVSCGGVWVTANSGETWENRAHGMRAEYMPPERASDPNIQDPHRVVQCKAAPERFWAQHHNGIFRTTDATMQWTEIKDVRPSTFGFAVVVHPREPDTAWFVPALKDEKRIPVDGKLVVTRTRDGGRSFDVLRRGLPQEHAYDLVYRHGMDIDGSGERLAFGSTTGGLWTSNDQGEFWTMVSANLPPIYCVRFVG